jgi:hypothetical protein
MRVTGRHGRIVTRDGEGERVVLDVGPENNALGECVHIGGRRGGALQFARRQRALGDVADGDAALFRRAAVADMRAVRIPDAARRVVGDQAVDLVERDGRIGTAGSELLVDILRHVEGRGVAQIADQRRHVRVDTDVDADRVTALIDVVVEVAVEIAVGVEVAVAVQIAVAVAVQIAVQIGGNLRLGLTLALEAQLALAFALALTLILVLIIRIPPKNHDVSPCDVKTYPSLRGIADLLRLRSTNDLRQPFTSVKLMKFWTHAFQKTGSGQTASKTIRPVPIKTNEAHCSLRATPPFVWSVESTF